MENDIKITDLSDVLQLIVKKITQLDIIKPTKHQFKDILDFIDSFTKSNTDYRLLFLFFQKYYFNDDNISQNLIKKDVELILSLIDIDNNEIKEKKLTKELYDDDELFRKFYNNFVEDGQYSAVQTIYGYYYCLISDDFRSYLESYIFIKCEKDDYLMPVIPSNTPNINPSFFFNIYNKYEDDLIYTDNNGAYKIILEKDGEDYVLKNSNLEINEYEQYINSNEDKLKKSFKKKFPKLFGQKSIELINNKKKVEDKDKIKEIKEIKETKEIKEVKNEKINPKDIKEIKKATNKIVIKEENAHEISNRNSKSNESNNKELNKIEINIQTNEEFKEKEKEIIPQKLEKIDVEFNEQEVWFNLEIKKLKVQNEKQITSLNIQITNLTDQITNLKDENTKQNIQIEHLKDENTKQNIQIENLNDQNNRLKSEVKKIKIRATKLRHEKKILISKMSKLQNENNKIKNRDACKCIIDYLYGTLKEYNLDISYNKKKLFCIDELSIILKRKKNQAFSTLINFINKIYDMMIEGNNLTHWHDTAENAIKNLISEKEIKEMSKVVETIMQKTNASQSIQLILNLYELKYKEKNNEVKKIIDNLNQNISRKESFLNCF